MVSSITLSLVSKTDSGTLNNTYLNNFEILNKVFKKIEIKNFKIRDLIIDWEYSSNLSLMSILKLRGTRNW